MRKFLLLVPLVLVLLVSGCTSQDPREILNNSIVKLEALGSYTASYELTLSMYGMELTGEMELYKKGEKARVDTGMGMAGQSVVSSSYVLPSGTYTCAESGGNITCTKGEAQSVLSPEESVKMNMDMIDSGVITLGFRNIASIIERNCYNVSSVFDISKLGELDSGAMAGLGIDEEVLGSLGAFTRFEMTSCYDFETGMPLEMSMVLGMDMSKLPEAGDALAGEVTMAMLMRARGFEPNAEIPDSVFELPIEISEIQEACTDSGTGESMTLQEARDIALASSCMENATLVDGTELCNEVTGTWWIDLDLEREGCNPACVVSIPDGSAEINWRCTGLIPE